MDKNPEGPLSESTQNKSFEEGIRARIKRMDARAESATKALGLDPKDRSTVLSAIYDVDFGKRRAEELFEGLPESESDIRPVLVQDTVASMIIVDTAAKALMERLGLPAERRYEVLRVLWGKSSETGEEPSFEDSMKEAVERMEADAERAANELGLPPEKQGDLLTVLYGESGKDVRDQYRSTHPKESTQQSP